MEREEEVLVQTSIIEERENEMDVDAVCRVCHGEGEPTRPLFHPCRCSGSIKYLHQDCLMEWLRVSKKSDMRCELCGEKFSFRRVYAPDAPTLLSLSEFLVGLAPILSSHVEKVCRVIILSFFWVFLMPYGSMWWLNLCLGYLSYGTWNWGPQKLTHFDSLVLWWDGVIVSALIGVATFCLIVLVRPILAEIINLFHLPIDRVENDDATHIQRVGPVERPEISSLTSQNTIESDDLVIDGDEIRDDEVRLEGIDLDEIQNTSNFEMPMENAIGDIPNIDTLNDEAVIHQEQENIPLRNADQVDIPVRNPVVDLDQQFQEVLLTSSLWKPIALSFLFLTNNVVFLSSFLLTPIQLGRIILSCLVKLVLLTQAYTTSFLTPDVLKFNVQHHDPYLYSIIFRIFENHNYPLPSTEGIEILPGALNGDESIGETNLYDFNLLHSYSKVPMTVDRMTNKVLLILEISVGYLLLLTVILVVFSIYLLLRGSSPTSTRHSTQNNSTEESLPFLPHDRQRLVNLYTEVSRWFKVSLFLSIEYSIIPHLIGWILDLVTLNVFSSTIQSRFRFFQQNPLICMFLHFVIGLLFIVHVAIFASELRKVLQAQHLTKILPHHIFDFDENTFEMIANSSLKSLFERSLVKLSLSLPSILFMVLIPTQFGHHLFPGNIRQYQLNYGDVSYDVQLPLELLLFHFFLPALIRKYNHAECVRAYVITTLLWCSDLVGLRSYLLDQEIVDEFVVNYFPQHQRLNENIQIRPFHMEVADEPVPDEPFGEEIETHQSDNDPINSNVDPELFMENNVQPVPVLPRFLALKCVFVSVTFSLATSLLFTFCLHIPLIIGRSMMDILSLQTGNDYYSLSIGYSIILGLYFVGAHVAKEAHNQAELIAFVKLMMKWTVIGTKTFVLGSIWLTVLPLLVGILIEAIFIIPLWTPLSESPVFSFLQAWAVGLLALTAWIRGVLYGVFGSIIWRLRFQLILFRGFERIDFSFTFFNVIVPLTTTLLDHLVIPYCGARILGLFFLHSYYQRSLIMRYSFFHYFVLRFTLRSYDYVYEKVMKLHNDIRDSRYLLGTELNNR